MRLKILHLEDNSLKQSAIERVIRSVCNADIDWVTDVNAGFKKVEEAMKNGDLYDLAVSDMHYPLSYGLKPDWEAGEHFLRTLKNQNISLPVIMCSSANIKIPEAYGCVWYNEKHDWKSELRGLIQRYIQTLPR